MLRIRRPMNLNHFKAIYNDVYVFIMWKIYKPIVNFPSKAKCWYQRARYGYSYMDVWNLDSYLAEIISRAVRDLQKINHGYPGGLTEKKWNAVLDKIAGTFELYLKSGDIWSADYDMHGAGNANKLSKQRHKEIEKGMQLFIKHFGDLWD